MEKTEQYPFEGLNELAKQLHQFQVDAGFGEATEERRMMLIHSEISEAYEAFRKENFTRDHIKQYAFDRLHDENFKDHFEKLIKDTMEDELIDTFIRLVAFMGERKIDIEFHAINKMRYNHMRGYKYGGKKF